MQVEHKSDNNRGRPQDRKDSRTRQFNGQFVVPLKRPSNEFSNAPLELPHKANDSGLIGSGGRSRRNSKAPSAAGHAKGKRRESISMGQLDALERMSLKEPPANIPGKQSSSDNPSGNAPLQNGGRGSAYGAEGRLSTDKGSNDTAGNVAPSLHTLSREFDALSKKLLALESNPSSANQSRSASEAKQRGSVVLSARDKSRDASRPPLIEHPVLPSSLVGFDAVMAAEAQFRSRSGSAGSSVSSSVNHRHLPRLSETPAGSHVHGRRGSTRTNQSAGQLVLPRAATGHNDSAVKSRHPTPARSPRKSQGTPQTSKTALRTPVPASLTPPPRKKSDPGVYAMNGQSSAATPHKTPLLSIPGTASAPSQAPPLVPDIHKWADAIPSSKDSERTQDSGNRVHAGYETESDATGVSSKGAPALLETAKPPSSTSSENGDARPTHSNAPRASLSANGNKGTATPVPERNGVSRGLPYPTDSSSLQSSPIGFLTPTPRKGEEETMRYLSPGSTPGERLLNFSDEQEYPMFFDSQPKTDVPSEAQRTGGKQLAPQNLITKSPPVSTENPNRKRSIGGANEGPFEKGKGTTSIVSSDAETNSSLAYPNGNGDAPERRRLNYKGRSPSKVIPSGKRSFSVNKPVSSRNPERPTSSNVARVLSARTRQNQNMMAQRGAPAAPGAARPKSSRSRQGSAAPRQSLARVSNESGSRGFGDYGYETGTSGAPSETTTPTTQPLQAPTTTGENTPAVANRTRGGRIRVLVRKRPLGGADTGDDCVRVTQPRSLHVEVTKLRVDLSEYNEVNDFEFDAVFSEDQGNEDVYKQSALPLIETALEGGSASCFAYGQTGSGKTYTMMGTESEKGIYLLAAADLFKQMKPTQTAYVSLYEIYCNSLFDLLNNRAPLILREDANRQVNICGLTSTQVTDVDEVLSVVSQGAVTRSTGSTSANEHSSRSHAVLAISVFDSEDPKFCGTINFVDLAGSERAVDTANNDKQTRLEGAEINKSLLALKECIRGLDERRKHIPFRGSKLTEVLRDSFSGNCRTVMIAAVSPSSDNYEHSLNTIRYAFRVKGLSVPTIGPSKARNAPRPYIPVPRPAVSPSGGSNYRSDSNFRAGNNGSPSKQPSRSESKQRRSPQKYPYNPHSSNSNGGDASDLWRPNPSESLLPDINMSNGVSRRSSEFGHIGDDLQRGRKTMNGDLRNRNADSSEVEQRITESIMQQLREEMGDRMRAMLAKRDATIASLTSENRVLRREIAGMKKKLEQRPNDENGSGRGPQRTGNDGFGSSPTSVAHLPDISKMKRYTSAFNNNNDEYDNDGSSVPYQRKGNQQNRGKPNTRNKQQQQLSKQIGAAHNQPTDESDDHSGEYPMYGGLDRGGVRQSNSSDEEWPSMPSKASKPVKRTTARPVVQPKRYSSTQRELYSDDEWGEL